MNGRQFTEEEEEKTRNARFTFTTDVPLFHFSDKPKATLVCHILFSSRFFDDVTQRIGYDHQLQLDYLRP